MRQPRPNSATGFRFPANPGSWVNSQPFTRKQLEGKVAAVEDQCLQAQTASDCEQRLVSSERLHSCPPLQLGS